MIVTSGLRKFAREVSNWIDLARVLLARVTLDNFDSANDVAIELRQLVRRYPKLLVRGPSRDLNGIFGGELGIDFESSDKSDVSGKRIIRIPITGDSTRVFH